MLFGGGGHLLMPVPNGNVMSCRCSCHCCSCFVVLVVDVAAVICHTMMVMTLVVVL